MGDKIAQLILVEMATEFLNAVRVRPCFFYTTGSVRPFPWFFLGWRVRMSVIRTAEIPKIGKIGAKIRASVYLKTSESVFTKKC